MAQSKLSPQEYIKNAFKPQVAAYCSASVTQICRKNNLSFTEMIQPFCKLGSDVFYKDFSGKVITIHNLELTVLDINYQPPQPRLAQKYLNALITHSPEPRFQLLRFNGYNLNVPITAPWFEEWRESFLHMQYPSDHEFTKHFLACLFVISTLDDPIETINELNQIFKLNQDKPKKIPKWFFPDILRYYVIVHDNFDGNNIDVNKVFNLLKENYHVSNCFLLRMNSRPPGQMNEQLPDPWSQFLTARFRQCEGKNAVTDSSPVVPNATEITQDIDNNITKLPYHPLSTDMNDLKLNEHLNDEALDEQEIGNIVHGCCLSTEDVEQIKLLIHEFCTRSLIPYVERKTNQFQQFFVNKSITSSTFLSNLSFKFKSNKPSKNNSGSDMFVYKPDAPELLMRKLGDLCFMFGNYTGAMQTYYNAQNDFLRDGASLYYAGAIEMYILSAFMAGEAPRKIFRDMEESIRTYQDVCKMPQFATRATLLIFECLKGHNLYGEAAHQLIRMTSEDSDLRSALLLEQAAYCFLNTTPKLVRKYAFHMVLSGHRFSKALQRKHALRCYNQALQIFRKRSWNLAEDHIYLTIGKLATSLNLLEEASEVFSQLNIESKQSPQQQATFLKEFLIIRNQLLKKENKLRAVELPLPLLDCDNVKVLVGPTPPLSIPGKSPAEGVTFSTCYDQETKQKWNKLEEILVQEAQGSLPLIFKPLISLYTRENISNSDPIAIIGEPIQVSVKMINLLDVVLYLKDIHLHWSFVNKDNVEFSNSDLMTNHDSYVKTFIIKSSKIEPKSSEEFILSVTPFCTGKIKFQGVAFCLSNAANGEDAVVLPGEQRLFIRDKKPIRKDDQELKVEKEIEITIVPSAPCLQVSFLEVSNEILCDEVQEIPMEIKNVGSSSVNKIYMATSTPQLLSVCEFEKRIFDISNINNLKIPQVKEKELRKMCTTQLPLPHDTLDSGQSHVFKLWIKAPSTKGPLNIDILIYYENTNSANIPRYRLVRHTWKFTVQESLSVKASCQQSFDTISTEQLLLSSKVTNLNKFHNLKLINISVSKVVLLSSQWILFKDLVAPKSLRINPEQSINLIFKAKRNANQEEICSEILLEPEALKPSILKEVCLDFAMKSNEQNINLFEENINVVSVDKKDHFGYLIIQWRALVGENSTYKRNVIGQTQTYLTLKEELSIDTSSSYEANQILDLSAPINNTDLTLETKSNQLTYNLVHPIVVRHDFHTNRACVVPVKLLLHNTTDDELTVVVNTLGTSSDSLPPSFKPNFYYQYPCKYFRWIGKSSAVKSVKPLNSETVFLFVVVFGPGTYDLGARLEIWCHKSEQPNDTVLQNCRAESALIVMNT